MSFLRGFRSRFSNLPVHKRFEYVPRYYDPEEEKRTKRREGKIKLEKGAFYKQRNKSRLVGAFTQREFTGRASSSGSHFVRVVLIAGMLFMLAAFFLGFIKTTTSMAVGTGFLVLLMVAFIAKTNKI